MTQAWEQTILQRARQSLADVASRWRAKGVPSMQEIPDWAPVQHPPNATIPAQASIPIYVTTAAPPAAATTTSPMEVDSTGQPDPWNFRDP